MAKRRKLPDEDLAGAVADMINSPITRANLSFLQPHQHEVGERTTPMGVEANPRGLGESLAITPVAFEATPTGVERDANELKVEPIPQPIRRFALPRLPPAPPPIQQSLGLPTSKTMWQAEQIGSLFHGSGRVRRIHEAQDALSPIEERVYNLLWGPPSQKREDFRLAQFSLQRIANEARINIRTVREMIPRLVDKGFLEVAAEADVRRNIPTTYRVWGYAAILERLRQQSRFYVVKTGKGVFYAHPILATLQPTTPPAYESTPMGVDISPPSVDSHDPLEFETATPMGSATSPMAKLPRPYEKLTAICREVFGAEPDRQLLGVMVAACHERAIQTTGLPATEDELIYFARMRAEVIRKAPNIRNHVAVLGKALPECFAGAAFRAYRSAAVAQQA